MEDNPNPQKESCLDDSLAFFGVITASVSHELNNVIAIMDQTTGLLEDRLSGVQEEIRIPPEKLEKIVTSLQKQAARGLDIIKRLNRFAHSADFISQRFDIGEILRNLIRLIERLATIKGVNLESKLPDRGLEIESNPFYLQQAVFTVFKVFLASAPKGDVISISLNQSDRKIEVSIEGASGEFHSEDNNLTGLQQIMERLSGEYKMESADQRAVIRLVLPGEVNR